MQVGAMTGTLCLWDISQVSSTQLLVVLQCLKVPVLNVDVEIRGWQSHV